MRGKKGSAHFEMIVGFVFFIGFVFFLFMFLDPWDNSALSNSALEKLYHAFREDVDTPLSSVFVKTEEMVGDCFYINLPSELFKKQAIADENSRVTKLGGDWIISDIEYQVNNFENIGQSNLDSYNVNDGNGREGEPGLAEKLVSEI